MIYEVGGGIPGGKKLKAVVPAALPPGLTADEIDIGMDFDQVAKPDRCSAPAASSSSTKRLHGRIRPPHHEVLRARKLRMVHPLREGTDWLKKSLTRLHEGGAVDKDIDNIRYLPKHAGTHLLPARRRGRYATIAFVKKWRKNLRITGGQGLPYRHTHQEDWSVGELSGFYSYDRTRRLDARENTGSHKHFRHPVKPGS